MAVREMKGLEDNLRLAVNRRKFLEYFSSVGLGATMLPGALLAQAQEAATITPEMVGCASKIAGVPLSEEARKRIAEGLNRKGGLLQNFQAIRDMKLATARPRPWFSTPSCRE